MYRERRDFHPDLRVLSQRLDDLDVITIQRLVLEDHVSAIYDVSMRDESRTLSYSPPNAIEDANMADGGSASPNSDVKMSGTNRIDIGTLIANYPSEMVLDEFECFLEGLSSIVLGRLATAVPSPVAVD